MSPTAKLATLGSGVSFGFLPLGTVSLDGFAVGALITGVYLALRRPPDSAATSPARSDAARGPLAAWRVRRGLAEPAYQAQLAYFEAPPVRSDRRPRTRNEVDVMIADMLRGDRENTPLSWVKPEDDYFGSGKRQDKRRDGRHRLTDPRNAPMLPESKRGRGPQHAAPGGLTFARAFGRQPAKIPVEVAG